MTINGIVGPRGDGYVVGERMTGDEAATYHGRQIGVARRRGRRPHHSGDAVLSRGGHRRRAGRGAAGVPVVPSFTVETDGRLPDGTPVGEAVEHVDGATGGAAEFFMLNCAHPTHIAAGLDGARRRSRASAGCA